MSSIRPVFDRPLQSVIQLFGSSCPRLDIREDLAAMMRRETDSNGAYRTIGGHWRAGSSIS